MSLFIEELDGPLQVEAKRFYIPYELSSICPLCGEVVEFCGYLTHPSYNEPFEVEFDHEFYDEDTEEYTEHEWTEEIVMRLSLESTSDG